MYGDGELLFGSFRSGSFFPNFAPRAVRSDQGKKIIEHQILFKVSLSQSFHLHLNNHRDISNPPLINSNKIRFFDRGLPTPKPNNSVDGRRPPFNSPVSYTGWIRFFYFRKAFLRALRRVLDDL